MNSGYGSGHFRVVADRLPSENTELALIGKLPQISEVITFNPMLIPPALNSIRDLRVLAAKLQADLLLIYTLDVVVYAEKQPTGMLDALTFDLFADQGLEAKTRTTGMLVDVRTGHIYGLLSGEGSAGQEHVPFRKVSDTDSLRQHSEQESYRQFVADFSRLWQSVLQAHASMRN